VKRTWTSFAFSNQCECLKCNGHMDTCNNVHMVTHEFPCMIAYKKCMMPMPSRSYLCICPQYYSQSNNHKFALESFGHEINCLCHEVDLLKRINLSLFMFFLPYFCCIIVHLIVDNHVFPIISMNYIIIYHAYDQCALSIQSKL
jgi:hypothetical protein